MQTKNITDMKHEWADGCKARSHGSDQVLIAHTARAGLFILVFYFQFAAQFLVCMYYFKFAATFLICMCDPSGPPYDLEMKHKN